MERMPNWDPSLPKFSYTSEDREKMKREKGLTDDEIDDMELAITTKQIESKIENEKRAA